jgi:S1-C subfamily serine protease
VANRQPKLVLASDREAAAICAHCNGEIRLQDPTALCPDCGGVHHLVCWQAAGGCGAYECPEFGGGARSRELPTLVVSAEDLAAAEPLPPAPLRTASFDQPVEPPRRNRVAVWSFVIALLGIPLFGLVTGLIAIVAACIALAGHSSRRRGAGFAVAALLIGLLDVIGWAIALSSYYGGPMSAVSLAELTIDPASLDDLPERIARAMRANVLIQANFGLGRGGIGSGVILKVRDGSAYIVTNRHVVDKNFTDSGDAPPGNLQDFPPVTVLTVGQELIPASVEWVAPHGVDLAIVSVPTAGLGDEIREAWWNVDAPTLIGDPVFAVGNPHGLGWTHSAGSISQIRRRTLGVYNFRVLQTTAAFNPGNSGGGLYDAEGRLVGINTLTGDKRIAEGLGFSIAIPTLMELVPESLGLPDANPEPEAVTSHGGAEGEESADP